VAQLYTLRQATSQRSDPNRETELLILPRAESLADDTSTRNLFVPLQRKIFMISNPPHLGVLNIEAIATVINGGQMKVLIVEDNSDMRDLLRLIVERIYYVPVLACHGKEGLEKAISEKPQLILLDMRMPVMDGWEAARALRANPDTKNIPILATTALFRPHELKTCLEAGCNGYIVKPFSCLDLQTQIRELLEPTSEQLGFN
jgi:two-component system, cell cycle response regulator DivK